MCIGINLLNKGLKGRIGKEDTVRFWSDNWHPMGILQEWTLRLISVEKEQLKVNYFLEDYSWKFDDLQQVLPREAAAKFVPIHARRNFAIEDIIIWGAKNNGRFTVKSAFELCLSRREWVEYKC